MTIMLVGAAGFLLCLWNIINCAWEISMYREERVIYGITFLMMGVSAFAALMVLGNPHLISVVFVLVTQVAFVVGMERWRKEA